MAQRIRKCIQLGLCLCNTQTALDSSNSSWQYPLIAHGLREWIGVKPRRGPHFNIRGDGSSRMPKSRFKNADDRIRIAIKLHLPSQNIGVFTKGSPPRAITDYYRFGKPLCLVLRAKYASNLRFHAK